MSHAITPLVSQPQTTSPEVITPKVISKSDRKERIQFDIVNEILLQQIQRISSDGLSGEALQEEIDRAEVMNAVTGKMIDLGNLQLNAIRLAENSGYNLKLAGNNHVMGLLEVG